MAPKLHFHPIWTCCDLYLQPLSLKYTNMLGIVLITIFNSSKFIHYAYRWTYGLKGIFVHISSPVVILIFDLQMPKPNHFIWKCHSPSSLKIWYTELMFSSKGIVMPNFAWTHALTHVQPEHIIPLVHKWAET